VERRGQKRKTVGMERFTDEPYSEDDDDDDEDEDADSEVDRVMLDVVNVMN